MPSKLKVDISIKNNWSLNISYSSLSIQIFQQQHKSEMYSFCLSYAGFFSLLLKNLDSWNRFDILGFLCVTLEIDGVSAEILFCFFFFSLHCTEFT